eukprot:PLAT5070.2.p1 GENE.PLAT5070.2~~PLAT5070.2.p1  ORF type:complete len:353 (-),score=144.65 PLAT5070.2:88-1038(-)
MRARGVKAARLVFKRARASADCTHHVFMAAGLLEYYGCKDTGVACKIFELGRKRGFDAVPEYQNFYIDFMSSLNDDSNMRHLFQRVLSSLVPPASRPVWDRYLQFTYRRMRRAGSLAAVSKAEQQRADALGDSSGPGLHRLLHRYCFRNLKPKSRSDRMLLERLMAVGEDEAGAGTAETLHLPRRARFCKPQTEGMLVFDPRRKLTAAAAGAGRPSSLPRPTRQPRLPIPDQRVPIPEFLRPLMSKLPSTWHGPLPNVDVVIHTLMTAALPPPPTPVVLPNDKRKRKRAEEDDFASRRPARDVFRERQAAKLRRMT